VTFTILRTAAGSPVAPFVIRALQSIPDIRVVAVDADPLSCGFHFADAHHVVPPVSDPGFLEAMLDVCRKERIDLVFPDLDEELLLLARSRQAFEALGTRVLLSHPDAIETCLDKYETYRFFRRTSIPTPETQLPSDLGGNPRWSWPRIVKPRRGRGSRHVYRVTGEAELSFFLSYVEDPLVQEYVAGTEYSIDTLSDLGGGFVYAAIRERITTDSGISIKGRTVAHPDIEAHAKRAVEAVGLVGPACLQCIEDGAGHVKFIEINPRIGGSAVLSMAAGAPLVSDAVRLVRSEPLVGLSEYRTGLLMLRHWAEIFIDPAAQAARDGICDAC